MKYSKSIFNYQNKISIYIPDPLSVKSTYDHLVQKDLNTPFPFWAKIWPSSIALSDYLQTNTKWIENKKVVEIGAGIGLPALSIARLASEILITDHANDAVALLQENINYLNLTNAAAKCLDWNSFPTDIKADTILLSDINYAPEQFDPLIILVNQFLKEGSTLILATPQRIMGIPFIKSLESYIKETHVHTIFEHEQPIDISILMLRLF